MDIKKFENSVRIQSANYKKEYEVTDMAMNIYKEKYACYHEWCVENNKLKKEKKELTADILTEIKSPINKIRKDNNGLDEDGEDIVKMILQGRIKIDERIRSCVEAFAYVYYWIGNMLPVPYNPIGLGDRGTWRNKVLYLCGKRAEETNLKIWDEWRNSLPPSWKNDFYLQDMFDSENHVKPFYLGQEAEKFVFFSKEEKFDQKEWFINNTKLIIQRSYRIMKKVSGNYNEKQEKEIKSIFKYVFKKDFDELNSLF